MNFLKKLLGMGDKGKQGDPQGIYFYVECDNCGATVRVRADKKYELNRTDEGFVWHKTIVDSKCFRQIPTVVHFDRGYNVVDSEIDGAHFISRAEYEAPPEPEEPEEETLELAEPADDDDEQPAG